MTNSTQITENQGVLRFDNSKMTKETKSTILEMISDKRFKEVENELFGLFDGFYYVDTLMEFCKESKLTTKYDLLMMLGFLHELDKRYEEI